MARSIVIVYEPLDKIRHKRDYWREYVSFFEQYWDAPSSPHSTWYGRDYQEFKEAISKYLGMENRDIRDCFFTKDENGNYYICPLNEGGENIVSHDNGIPLEWLLMFSDGDRGFTYTHTGFGTVQADGIYYSTKISLGAGRLKTAEELVEQALIKHANQIKSPSFRRLWAMPESVLNMRRWLLGFDSSARITLDYGEICSFIHPYTLRNEQSVKEIWDALHLISDEKFSEAKIILEAFGAKWDEIGKKTAGEIDTSAVQ
ncbi:MAG: hypothetical protein ACT4NX_02380 [Deltaproteobacteria bacterium]